MDFLHENITWAYLVFLGDLSSALPFTQGLFRNFRFSLDASRLVLWVKRDILRNALTFWLLSEDQVPRSNIFWLSLLNLADIRLTTMTLAKSWTGFMLNTFCPRVGSF